MQEKNHSSGIPAPNYTQIPNVVLDYWPNVLNFLEFRILLFVCRSMFGWPCQEPSFEDICNAITAPLETLEAGLCRLEHIGLIEYEGDCYRLIISEEEQI
jgi:hypothetical protein